MIDYDVVYKHLQELESILDEMDDFKNYSLEELKKEIKKLWQVEHGLQLAIQNLLDIGSHILSSIGKNKCENYTDVLDKLGEENIIPPEFSRKIRGMAGLRNLLVHDYIKIQTEKIYDYIKNNLNDFRKFIKYINKYLEN